uniref:SKI/SNO/DAC domain-containing protein n=1 Tax=Mola mola TaxID=94237 RepID=A0A3Q3XHW5_MOLML
MAASSTPPTDSLFHPEPPFSAPTPAGGRTPVGVNDCKLMEVHGAKVASFTVSGVELICLPQVFELFLRHLVGGLHTVYTKLKRLDISPVVCTVEQVRVLRGLGAIQPGVNRCKLISRADFETLYRDCTNASSRPGRPPKRSLGVAEGSRLLPHGLISPTLLSQTGLSAATMAEALKLQKMRMMMGYHGNCDQRRPHNRERTTFPCEHDDLSIVASVYFISSFSHCDRTSSGLSDIPFMVMPHPLLPVGLPTASVAMAMNQMTQLSGLANMAAMSQAQHEESKVTSPPGTPSPSPSPSDDELHPQEQTSQTPSRASSSSLSSPPPPAHTQLGFFNRRKTVAGRGDPHVFTAFMPADDSLQPAYEKLPLSINHADPAFAPFLLAEGLSSMETLLTNIQGLLKVAVQSARCQDKQNQMERKELKLELDKERDARQTVQRQLSSELQTRVSIQRRLKKEKKAKRKLQEALDFESRRREQVEQALKHSDLLTGDHRPFLLLLFSSSCQQWTSVSDSATPERELDNKEQEISAAAGNNAVTAVIQTFSLQIH